MVDLAQLFADMDRDASERAKNEAVMNAYEITVGDVFMRTPRSTVVVLGPSDTFPRNGKGLVRCRARYLDEDGVVTHFWPETLSHYQRIGNVRDPIARAPERKD